MLQNFHQRSQKQYQTATFQQKSKINQPLSQAQPKNVTFIKFKTQEAGQQTDRKFHNITEPTIEPQKVLIKKSDLQAFTKHFANQKIKFDQQRQTFSKKLIQYQNLTSQISKQIVLLKKQKNQYKQKFIKEQQNVKVFEKRIKQLQNFQVVQLKRNISQLQSKLRYEEEQLTRYQQFLKIKEEIIKNLQWEKSISNQRSKTQRSFNHKTQNAEQYYTERDTNINRNKFQNQRQKHSETLKLQDLSQIAQNTDQKFYGFTNNQTSKSKKSHIRIGASNQKQLVKGLHQEKNKKVITIKKRMNTQSQVLHPKKINKQQSEEMKIYEKQILSLQKTIQNLRQQAQIIQEENDKMLNDRKALTSQMNFSQTNNNPKISYLQKSLDQKDLMIQKLQNQLTSKNFNSSLNNKLKQQNGRGSQNNFNSSRKALQASNKFAADKDRSILILHQKCIMLQKQIQKFMKKIIMLQKKNKQMEVQLKKSNKKNIGSEQLITPQFKDIKFKKFFPKANNLNLSQGQLSRQNNKYNKSHITDTFSKNQLSSSLSQTKKEKQSPEINESSQQKKSIIRNFNIDQIDDDEESMALQSDLKLFK